MASSLTFFSWLELAIENRPEMAMASTPSDTFLMASVTSAFDMGATGCPLLSHPPLTNTRFFSPKCTGSNGFHPMSISPTSPP